MTSQNILHSFSSSVILSFVPPHSPSLLLPPHSNMLVCQIQKGPPTPKPRLFLPQNRCPGMGVTMRDSWRTSQQPGGAGVGFEDWADPSQMVVWLPGKKTSGPMMGGWSRTHTCTFKTDTRLTARVLLPSLMNTRSQTHLFISH